MASTKGADYMAQCVCIRSHEPSPFALANVPKNGPTNVMAVPLATPSAKGVLAAWPNVQAGLMCVCVFIPHKQAILSHT